MTCYNLSMDIKSAQADVRHVYRNGFTGPLVSGILWMISAAIAQTVNMQTAVVVFFVAGMFLFPITSLILKLTTGTAQLPKGHPMAALGMQTAFTVPIGLLVAVVLSLSEPSLFFCAAMLIVGAHYLPFCFLYGMKTFIVLACTLILSAFILVYLIPSALFLSGWIGGGILIAFSLVLYILYYRDSHSIAKTV